MKWIQTFSGKMFDLEHPAIDMVCLNDIAFSLHNLPRFNGHLIQWWSVLNHSMAVAELVHKRTNNPTAILQALLHDAAEAYIGDITTPVKSCLGDTIRKLEERILRTIFFAYDIPFKWFIEVKAADSVMTSTEAEYLFSVKPLHAWNTHIAPSTARSMFDNYAGTGPDDFIYEVNKWHQLSQVQNSSPQISTDLLASRFTAD